ncbi:MAG: DNA-binding family transcriptional regulator [Amycolatopsis sp.]|nr:DNA-binding family transcriptional regulator [Amycolatopsis sp.]
MDRRGFLIVTGGALAGLGGQWSSSLTGVRQPATVPDLPHDRLSAATLDRLDHRLADLRRLDDALGGRELHQLAVAEFRWLTCLADHAVYDSAAGQRLFGLVTEAARLCGWLHFDVAHHAAAQSYYVAALRSSASANDSLTGAHVLACMSFQATLTGHHQEAVTLIDTAEDQTKHAATPRLRAMLASRKARAYAKAGDAAACGRALNEAERRLDVTTPGTVEPDWIYFFDEAELAAQAAACWVDLDQPAKARPLIDNALSSMNPLYVRDRTIYHVRSAEAHLHAADLELACGELRTAAGLARQTGSVRSIDTIRAAREGMSRYDREPRVKELDLDLATLAA